MNASNLFPPSSSSESKLMLWLLGGCLVFSSVVAVDFRSTRIMENQALLEPTGQMKIRWTVIGGTGDIEMEILANCTSWMEVGFVSGHKGEPGALVDVILTGYDDETGSGYIQVICIILSVVVVVEVVYV